MLAVSPIDLEHTPNLQAAIEAGYADGIRDFNLTGTYRAGQPGYSLLRVGPALSGIRLFGSGAVLDGNGITSHVIAAEGADVMVHGLQIVGGDTTDAKRVGRTYEGQPGRSLYEAVDGAGILALRDSGVTVVNSHVSNNHSGMCGGGISNQTTKTLHVARSTFEGNTAFSTGAAIDNLTLGAGLIVRDTHFKDNHSNTGTKAHGPHGQITVFPRTTAIIENATFEGGSMPIDAPDNTTSYAADGQPLKVAPAGGHDSRLEEAKYRLRILHQRRHLARFNPYPMIRKDNETNLRPTLVGRLLKLVS